MPIINDEHITAKPAGLASSQEMLPGGWVAGPVDVRTDGGNDLTLLVDRRWAVVDGFVLGNIAVHPAVENKRFWSVSLIPMGIRILSVTSREDALRIGLFLRGKGWRAWKLETRRSVLKALPRWIEPWCRECNRQRQWVDPRPFEHGGKK